MTSPDPVAAFAARLLEARRSGRRFFPEAGECPATIAAAMRVQALVREGLGESVVGWKVAAARDGTPVAGPLFAGRVVRSGGRVATGFGNGLEAELALRLGRDLPPRAQPYSRDDILAATEAVLIGIEVVDSRFERRHELPFEALLADGISNGAYVVGPDVPRAALAVAGVSIRIVVDGRVLHDAPAVPPRGDVLASTIAYATRPCDALGGLKAGQIVTTGSLCGVVDVGDAREVSVAFSGLGEVTARR